MKKNIKAILNRILVLAMLTSISTPTIFAATKINYESHFVDDNNDGVCDNYVNLICTRQKNGNLRKNFVDTQ